VVTAGNVNDCTVFGHVVAAIREPRQRPERPRTRPDCVIADKACSSRVTRCHLRGSGITATIPKRADRQAGRARRGSRGGRPPTFNPATYRHRNVVERCIGKTQALPRHRHQIRQTRPPLPSTLTLVSRLLWLNT
jgi:hypothetical protein